jgi:hypothetical protein
LQYDDKGSEYKLLNHMKSKDVREKEKEKEYNYPPIPNIESAKQAFLKKRLEEMKLKMNNKSMNDASLDKINKSLDYSGS